MVVVTGSGEGTEVTHACRRPKLCGTFEATLSLTTGRLNAPGRLTSRVIGELKVFKLEINFSTRDLRKRQPL